MKDPSAGLLAAAFIGIVPGYISRSVAGSYDNEAIAIFLLMFTFYCWIKALKMGSALFGTIAAVFYFYMVAAWGMSVVVLFQPAANLFLGGYAFITNMIPLHALVLLLMGRYSSRLYVAYSSWYAIGTLASMQVPFVGFQPVKTSEHMAALGVFGLLQIVAFAALVRSHLSSKQFQNLLFVSVIAIGVLGTLAIVGLTYKGWIAPWTGRFYSLWDTGYAKKSVSSPLIVCPLLIYYYTDTSPLLLQYQSTSLLHGHHSSWTCKCLFSCSLPVLLYASRSCEMSMSLSSSMRSLRATSLASWFVLCSH